MQITTIGLDLAKHWFQVHGVAANGQTVVRKRLWRSGVIAYFRSIKPCLVGMEACATAHYWARELAALGDTVKLMPPAYVKAYVKRNKNDAADAEAICEAVTRPSMRFVPVKDAEQQSVLMLHRARNLLVRQRTMLVNALRAHMAEFDIKPTIQSPPKKTTGPSTCQARPRKALLVHAGPPARHQTPPQMPPAPKALGMPAKLIDA
jgi:transposase